MVSFVALGVVMSMRATLGLLMPVWEAEFGWSRSFISAGGALGSFLGGWLVRPVQPL